MPASTGGASPSLFQAAPPPFVAAEKPVDTWVLVVLEMAKALNVLAQRVEEMHRSALAQSAQWYQLPFQQRGLHFKPQREVATQCDTSKLGACHMTDEPSVPSPGSRAGMRRAATEVRIAVLGVPIGLEVRGGVGTGRAQKTIGPSKMRTTSLSAVAKRRRSCRCASTSSRNSSCS